MEQKSDLIAAGAVTRAGNQTSLSSRVIPVRDSSYPTTAINTQQPQTRLVQNNDDTNHDDKKSLRSSSSSADAVTARACPYSGFINTQQPQSIPNNHKRGSRQLMMTRITMSADALTVTAPLFDSCMPCFAHDPIKLPSHSDGLL